MSKSTSTRKIATKALEMAKENRSISEVRQRDNAAATLTAGTAWTFIYLSGVAQGDDFNERIGRKIKAISIQLLMQLIGNTSAVLSQRMRFVLFWDKENQQADPTALEVFTADDIETFPNATPNLKKRFKILWDHTFVLGNLVGNGTSTLQRTEKTIKKFLRLSRTLTYATTGATVVGAAQNALFLAHVSDDGVNSPTAPIRVRFSYRDG